MFKRVLLKLSGEALSDGKMEPFCNTHLLNVANEIKEIVKENIQVCIVVGGGNLYRGKIGVDLGMDRCIGDQMGMLATLMNSLALSNALKKVNVENIILSALEVKGIAKQFSTEDAQEALSQNKVVIYGAGTGLPYFSTDTCSALRALQSKCDAILVAKNGVDGIYSADPKKDQSAIKYDEITYQEILEKNLQVMDLTAISLCKENHMPLVVFNMNKTGNIVKACNGEKIGTIVK